MCRACGGQCCKENGCIFLPQDFSSLDFEFLKTELDKGNISISGQPLKGFYNNAWTFLLYLRARNRNADIVDLITSGGPCKMLSDTGCLWEETQRPSLGLLVKPTKIGGPCEKKYDSNIALDWINYNDVLSKLVTYYTNKKAIDIISEEITKFMNTIRQNKPDFNNLNEMQKTNISWYYNIMADKPYYTPEEVKRLILIP